MGGLGMLITAGVDVLDYIEHSTGNATLEKQT